MKRLTPLAAAVSPACKQAVEAVVLGAVEGLQQFMVGAAPPYPPWLWPWFISLHTELRLAKVMLVVFKVPLDPRLILCNVGT